MDVDLAGTVGETCGVCGRASSAFVLTVRYERGDAVAVAGPLRLCRPCEALYSAGRDADLAGRMSDDGRPGGPEAFVAHLRERGTDLAEQPVHPKVERLRAAGYQPLAMWTGWLALGAVWPGAHRVALAAAEGPATWRRDEDDVIWFVRSPWPSLSLDDVFGGLLWPWVERDPAERDPDVMMARARDALAWDEDRAQAWLRLVREG